MPSDEQALERAIYRALRKAVFLVFGLYLLVQFLGAVTFLVLLFALVFLLAASLNPIVVWLHRHRIPRPVSAVGLGVIVLGGIAAALWLALPPLVDQGQELAQDFPQLWNGLRERLERFLANHPALAGPGPDFGRATAPPRPRDRLPGT